MRHLVRAIFLGMFLWTKNALADGYFLANPSTGLPTVITTEEARDLFMAKTTTFKNGVRVQVFLMDRETLSSRRFLSEVLKISPTAYFDRIDMLVASGKTNLPREVDTEFRMLTLIRVTTGGIGFGAKDLAEELSIKVIFLK